MTARTNALNVLIASPLEAGHADRIAAADARVNLLYEPDLLPVPRYPSDHVGTARGLDAGRLARWASVRREADVSFDFDWQAPAQIPANCPRLRWIQGTSAGIGGLLDRTGLIKTPIVFTTASGVHGVPLAEFALLGLLHFAKDMPLLARWQAERHWERHAMSPLRGSRVLLIGLGGVGREVARVLDAVGVQVCGAGLPGRRYDVPGVTHYVADTQIREVLGDVDAVGVQVCGAGLPGRRYDVPGVTHYVADTQIREVLGDVDGVILACPLTDRTRHLIGRAEIALLRPGAVLVNLSRGQVVDEAALTDALAEDRIGGACLDVFETEPLPAESPLWAMKNVIISPHSASTVPDENRLLTDLFIDNIGRWLAGEPLRNVFDKDAGY